MRRISRLTTFSSLITKVLRILRGHEIHWFCESFTLITFIDNVVRATRKNKSRTVSHSLEKYVVQFMLGYATLC